ncbi:MAG TPA: TIGR04282 family arsenosugar biosynthesis glycosyltransferase [Gemmataceae bacterium]|nr:TIGR04282 family arsenosugar biosynthesis glycosyltransferase [Gemmataceae bacterium]
MIGGPVLLVFLKYPEPGKVKTRLAAEFGAEVAARLYREWVGGVLRAVQAARRTTRVVGYFDGAPAERFTEWAALVDEWLPQPTGDLGTRLAAGFAWGHECGGPILAIGTDCLDLHAFHLAVAVEELRSQDVVFGPTSDGGYYLVGTRRHVPGFFDGVRWSSPHTLADHRGRCRKIGLTVALLPTLDDIDTAADLLAYEARGKGL